MLMSTPRSPALRLETTWNPPADGKEFSYVLRLKNLSSEPLSDFTLCVSGPGRVDPAGIVESATVTKRLSNFTEFQPPEGFVLAGGGTWTITVRALSWQFRHWNDGANSAYLAFADGTTVSLGTEPTRTSSSNAPLKRGAEVYPVPANPPVPLAIIPWPNRVAVSFRRPLPAGFALKAKAPEAQAAAESFTALVEHLFSAEGLIRSEAEGAVPVELREVEGLGAEAYKIVFSPETITVEASAQTGFVYGLVTIGQIWRGARLHPQAFHFLRPARSSTSPR